MIISSQINCKYIYKQFIVELVIQMRTYYGFEEINLKICMYNKLTLINGTKNKSAIDFDVVINLIIITNFNITIK